MNTMHETLNSLLIALSKNTSDRDLRLLTADALERRGRTDEAQILREAWRVVVTKGHRIEIIPAPYITDSFVVAYVAKERIEVRDELVTERLGYIRPARARDHQREKLRGSAVRRIEKGETVFFDFRTRRLTHERPPEHLPWP